MRALKRTAAFLLTVMMVVGLMPATAQAAEELNMTVTASAETVKPGDIVAFTVSVDPVSNVTSGGFVLSYDKSVFEFVNGTTDSQLSAFMVSQVSTVNNNLAGVFAGGTASLDGALFTFNMKVLNTPVLGETVVTGVPSIKVSQAGVPCGVVPASVEVDCLKMTTTPAVETVYPGDVLSVTVSTEAVSNATAGGFILNFDETVFAYIDGTISDRLSGFTIKTISTANDRIAGTFAGDAANVEGDLFTFNLRVKEDTAFGKTEITGISSMSVDHETITFGTKPCTVSVECRHEATSMWTAVDDNEHSRICPTCNGAVLAKHTWDAGKVTTEATTEEEGEKTYTCSDCKATKTEKIDKLAEGNDKTADATDVALWTVVMVLAVAGMAVTIVAKKRAYNR